MDDREIMALMGRVSALEAQVEFLYRHFDLTFVPEKSFDDPRLAKVYELVKQGKMVEAIQAHRQIFHTDLVDAKRAVEDLRGQIK